MKILIICTGNSCRSQMAEGFLKSFDPEQEVYSAGTDPANEVHPKTIHVMKEKNIDLSHNHTKKVQQFIDKSFDYVITVCDSAKESCPLFLGKVEHRLHMGFEDPAGATGTEEKVLSAFRKVRDQIEERFKAFYEQNITKALIMSKKI